MAQVYLALHDKPPQSNLSKKQRNRPLVALVGPSLRFAGIEESTYQPVENAFVAFFNPRQVRSTARKTGDFIAGFGIASMRRRIQLNSSTGCYWSIPRFHASDASLSLLSVGKRH
jgi:hypothetical protein